MQLGFPLLSDPDERVIKRYGLLHAKGHGSSDIARPADLLLDSNGVIRWAKTRVVGHHVMRLVLDSGAVLEISPGHPTADGRRLRELRAGSALDPQHAIVSAELVPYAYDATYDVLPASSTGTYFAAGALIGSTLAGARPEP